MQIESGERGVATLRGATWIAIVAFLLLLTALPGSATAAPGCEVGAPECPPLLGETGELGTGAGQIRNPRGLVADPNTGNLFVAEPGQARVSEFDWHGEFVKAWGWGVKDGTAELQVCTTATGCMVGISGSGPGQMAEPNGLALDASGNIWVQQFASLRVDKFTTGGEFILTVGGEVNKTRVKEREEQEANAEPVTVTGAQENVCTAASGDECGAGTSGTGQGQFEALGVGNSIAAGPDGMIYVGDEDRIQKFAEDGTYQGDIPLPGAGVTRSLTVDPTGRIYVISENVKEKISTGPPDGIDSRVVREIGPGGEELTRLKGQWQGRITPRDPLVVVTDVDGNVYVSARVIYDVPVAPGDPPKWKSVPEVVAFDPAGNLISFEPDKAGFGAPADKSELLGLGTNAVQGGSEPGEVFVGHFEITGSTLNSYIRVYGIPFERPPGPPSIKDQYVTDVFTTEATVEAMINPGNTAGTTYQVEFGTGKCSEEGCESLIPVPPALLGNAGSSAVPTGPVILGGLQPATTYHYRFTAQNSNGAADLPPEGTFRTYGDFPIPPCANDARRKEAFGEFLPDCRAYEMVSPVDKEGGETLALTSLILYPAEYTQADVGGEALTYSSYRAFSDPEAAPFTSQYLSKRTSAGWVNEPISPRREGVLFSNLDTQYKAFTEDLSRSLLVTDSEPPLADGALEEYRNLYQRHNDGTYGLQCPFEPPVVEPTDFKLEPQGWSADGSHVVFRANDKLTPDAAEIVLPQLYECVDGTTLRLVSKFEGGEASAAGASAGMARGVVSVNEIFTETIFRQSSVVGAVSSDGSRIFWTAAADGAGPLYVRIDGSKTVEISAASARFRMASPDGTRVIYTVGNDLFEASIGSEAATSSLIAGDVNGVMGASEDAQLVYFVSREDLDGTGPALAGKPNLYLHRAAGDSETFVATLSALDARASFSSDPIRPVLTPIAEFPVNRSSRVTADGLHAAFTSSASLTGYDNTDRASGKADAEVFLYDAEAGELLCVSCNPTGAQPQGENAGSAPFPFWAAAKIPGWDNQVHASRVLAEDGSRLFFEAVDALALGDNNGVQDVYQWEAPGTGTCTESSATYSPANGGCVDLISSGKSPQVSRIVDASSDGDDIFFKTTESLWPLDPGLTDIYSARVDGGFKLPPPPVEPCEGNCQQRGPAPAAPSPTSATFVGPGNEVQKPKPPAKRCRKGTHKVKKNGKVRCVKNRKGKAGQSRRAGR